MITDKTNILNSPVRSIGARVELYENSALADVYNQYYALKSFTIERIGDESKFFGYGICQKMNLKLVDKDRQIHITTIDSCKAYLSSGGDYINSFPEFFVSQVRRDENTNELSVTLYDALYAANSHTFSELELRVPPYTIKQVATAITTFFGLTLERINITDTSFNTSYPEGANLDGTETIRSVLDAIAEITQSIYYISGDKLVFKRLDKSGAEVLTIDKESYFTLDSGDNKRLKTICHTTELGDNVSASIEASGSTQYIRDNPFWDLREDIATLLDAAIAAMGGFTINQFTCNWRGNFLLEIGDKIALITKDNSTVYSYLLNDTLTYDGTLSQVTEWHYSAADTETESNPASIGDAIKQTYARVDKATKEIELMVSEVDINSTNISNLMLNTDSISATVEEVKTAQGEVDEAIAAVMDNVNSIASSVEAKMSAEDVTLQIQTELSNGVDKVTTSTGFTFNEEGLTVSKSGSEMETKITEDGMIVYKDGEAVLTANNTGVDAVNLHATTYLTIGTNSRFEDYNYSRTGCFWIGSVG